MTRLQVVVCLLLTGLYVTVVIHAMLTNRYELAGIVTPVVLVPLGFLFGKGLFNVTVERRRDEEASQ